MGKNYAVKELNEVIKESLQISLLSLLKEKNIDKISITLLCEKAGVSRTSFYRNYNDKKDVLRDYLVRISTDFSYKAPTSDIREYYIALFKHLYNIREIIIMLKRNDLMSLAYDIWTIYSKKAIVFLPRNEYVEWYMAGGTFMVMIRWLENGFEETPDEIADKLYRFVSKCSFVDFGNAAE